MKFILSVLISFFLPISATHADTEKVSQAELFLRNFDNSQCTRSGTSELLRMLQENSEEGRAFQAVYAQSERPEMDAFADSEKGRFRVHYDLSGMNAPDLTDNNLNNIPDYVDSALVYLEYAWQVIVVDHGYGVPMYDGTRGGSKNLIDCYIMDISPQKLYGLTNPDGFGSGSNSSYITVDNSFSESIYPTKGYNALKITTAHEFFHVVHYSYYAGYDSIWWMEQTAVWMEDQIWDDVNDYLNYIGFLYTDRNIPLDSSIGNFMYGATLFAFHIAEKYGKNIIRSSWSTIRDKQSGAIENLNTVLSDGLPKAISDLGVWMYFTGYRANPENFFSESKLITNTIVPEITTTEKTSVDSLLFRHYTFKYIEIKPENGFAYGDSLYFYFTDRSDGVWKNQVIFYKTPDNFEVEQLSGSSPALLVPRPFDKAVLVIANTSQRDKSYNYVFTIDIESSRGVEKEPTPVPFVLHQNFPNPFNSSTTIPFSIHENSHVTLIVVNIQGSIVTTLVDDFMGPGSYHATFDSRGISSGTYFTILESGGTAVTKKMSLLK